MFVHVIAITVQSTQTPKGAVCLCTVSEPRLVPNPNRRLATRALSVTTTSLSCLLEHVAEHHA